MRGRGWERQYSRVIAWLEGGLEAWGKKDIKLCRGRVGWGGGGRLWQEGGERSVLLGF